MLKNNRTSLLFTAMIAGLLIYAYLPTLVWLYERWAARDSYYAHGFLIPLVSLYWIFKKREALVKDVSADQSFWGIGLFVFAAALQLVSSFLRIYFLSAASLVFVLLGLTGILYGPRVLRHIWYPISFLSLAVPLPLLVISQTTLKMKFFVSEMAAQLITLSGIKAVREGSYIFTPHSYLLVGDPCSGLRSFLAFVCLGFVFAYQCKLPLWKRLILVFSGLPLAILSNIGRVYFLGVFGEIYGQESVHGFVHDASGVAVFIVAFGAFMGIRSQLESSNA